MNKLIQRFGWAVKRVRGSRELGESGACLHYPLFVDGEGKDERKMNCEDTTPKSPHPPDIIRRVALGNVRVPNKIAQGFVHKRIRVFDRNAR